MLSKYPVIRFKFLLSYSVKFYLVEKTEIKKKIIGQNIACETSINEGNLVSCKNLCSNLSCNRICPKQMKRQ